MHLRRPGLMTFREQPTVLFVPLECRYATRQLQPQTRATKLPEVMWERGEEIHLNGPNQQAIKLELKGEQVLMMETRMTFMAAVEWRTHLHPREWQVNLGG